jgi:hypothetical protein
MNTTAIACLASAAIAAAGAWAYQGHRYNAQLSDVRREYLQRDFKALEAQYAETVRYQQKADTAAKNAADRVRKLAADRDILRGAVERLRNDLTASGNAATDTGATTTDNAMQQPQESYQQSVLTLLQRWQAMLTGGEVRQ